MTPIEASEIFGTAGAELPSGRFTTRGVDLDAMRPTRFLWNPWLPRGRLNLMVGREKIGKSSFRPTSPPA